jgi:hypothetical protein
MGQSLVIMVCRVDRYWRSDGSLCSVLDLVIRPIPLHNHTITALTITIKVLRAYNIVQVLGGCFWNLPGHGGLPSRPILAENGVIVSRFCLGDVRNFTQKSLHYGSCHSIQIPASI